VINRRILEFLTIHSEMNISHRDTEGGVDRPMSKKPKPKSRKMDENILILKVPDPKTGNSARKKTLLKQHI
jgi:hypothetical protein